MGNKVFRKKILHDDIDRLKKELEKNQEFINLFLKNNNELLKQIENRFEEIEIILQQENKLSANY